MSRRERITTIIREVCVRHRVKANALLGKGRSRALTFARAEAIYRCRAELAMTINIASAVFGCPPEIVIALNANVRKTLKTGKEWPCLAGVSSEPFDVGPIVFTEPNIGRPFGSVSAPRKPPLDGQPAIGPRAAKAQTLADQINRYWRARGIEANARPVWEGGRIVVKSSVSLVERAA